MKAPARRLCQCIGIASLLLVMNYGEFLGGGADVRLHVPFALRGVVLAQIAGILGLGFGIFAAVSALLYAGFDRTAYLLPAILVSAGLIQALRPVFPHLNHAGVFPGLCLVWTALFILFARTSPRVWRQVVRAGDAVGVFLAIFAVTSLAQLLWVLRWTPGPQRRSAVWADSAQPKREHPRLVWIVFDELSYQQLFESRTGDTFPAFEALTRESTVFSNAQPVGTQTVKILPSLLTGSAVDEFRYTFGNRFLIRDAGQHGWQPLTGQSTVFHDAQQQGWRTAVVGWYNPYCTIYGDAIDDCYWTNLDSVDGSMSPQSGFLSNTMSPLRQTAREIVDPKGAGRDGCDHEVRQRLSTHLDLRTHALELLKTDQADFVFLHLPIPHSPNIWNRRTNAYTTVCGSSYADNLALADHMLGEMMQVLRGSPRWQETTVIVEGDHGWRVPLWDALPAWTEEDRRTSGGVFDTRPAVLIHQAGQRQPQVHAAAWPLLNVHAVLEQVLRGEAVRF